MINYSAINKGLKRLYLLLFGLGVYHLLVYVSYIDESPINEKVLRGIYYVCVHLMPIVALNTVLNLSLKIKEKFKKQVRLLLLFFWVKILFIAVWVFVDIPTSSNLWSFLFIIIILLIYQLSKGKSNG